MNQAPWQLATAAQMRELDRRATEEFGIPGIVLMENAARVFVRFLLQRTGDLSGRRVAVLCGKGNNGGDGLAIARYLFLAGARVEVYLVGSAAELKGDARTNFEIWQRLSGSVEEVRNEDFPLREKLTGVEIIVDAIFGTGFKGAPRPPAGWVIEVVNALAGAAERWGEGHELPTSPGLSSWGQVAAVGTTGLTPVAVAEAKRPADMAGASLVGSKRGRPRVFSVDLPSGLDADSGQAVGPCLYAEATVTFGLAKPGLLVYPGASYAGEVYVGNISLPPVASWPPALKASGSPAEYYAEYYEAITAGAVCSMLPPRPADSHKGTFGHLLVVAGSRGLTGAAVLASRAALRVGAGLVTLAVPERLQELMAAKLTEVMTLPLPDTGTGFLAPAAGPALIAALANRDGLVLGPGLSTQSGPREALDNLLQWPLAQEGRDELDHGPAAAAPTSAAGTFSSSLPSSLEPGTFSAEVGPARKEGGEKRAGAIPLVLDADGLNLLGSLGGLIRLRDWPGPKVLTPHPGELARLLQVPREEISRHRFRWAKEAARLSQAVVVLKGARTLVALPEGEIYINLTGNPGMATGGTGDVLAGVIGGLLVQGLEASAAARLGVFLHGLAGDLAAQKLGQAGLLAGDVLEALPAAILALARGEGPELPYLFL